MSAGHLAEESLPFTRLPGRRKPPGSKRLLADLASAGSLACSLPKRTVSLAAITSPYVRPV